MRGGIVSAAYFNNVATLPLAIPQTRLLPGTAVEIASFTVPQGRSFRIRYLNLNVVYTESNGNALARATDFFDTVYVGVFAGLFDQINRVTAMPVYYVGVDGAGYEDSDYSVYSDFASSGLYVAMLVNNTSTHTYEAVATGALRVY